MTRRTDLWLIIIFAGITGIAHYPGKRQTRAVFFVVETWSLCRQEHQQSRHLLAQDTFTAEITSSSIVPFSGERWPRLADL